MTVDLSKSHGKTVDPVNAYAVIALVAALLGLFPIAIVFGTLTLWRLAGRGLAIAALVLGAIGAIVVATVVCGLGTGLAVLPG